MEDLLTKLKKTKSELDTLKARPTQLESKITAAQTKYTGLMDGNDIKSAIDAKFTEAKTTVETFIQKFISARKKDLIYEKPSDTTD